LYAVERNDGAEGPGRSLWDRKADRREAYLKLKKKFYSEYLQKLLYLYGYTNPFQKVYLQVLSFKGRVKEKP